MVPDGRKKPYLPTQVLINFNHSDSETVPLFWDNLRENWEEAHVKTAIVTDSNSGIFEEEGKQLGVFVLPMPVLIDNRVYFEGRNISSTQFYQYLQEGRDISTSQPSPGDLTALWDQVLELGYDELVYIPMSSGLSSSCATAKILAEDYEGKVFVVDNHRISVTQRYSVLDALALAGMGCTGREIHAELERSGLDSIIYIGVETLLYLKRGGRITPAAAAMGTIMGIKPLLMIQGDKLDACAKVRGTVNCKKRLMEYLEQSAEEYAKKGIPFQAAAAGSFLTEPEAQAWKNLCQELFPEQTPHYDPLTCSIGTHVGPGAFGMAVTRRLVL